MKKKIFFMFSVVFLISSLFGVVFAKEEGDQLLEEAIEKRSSYGMKTEKEYVKNLIEQNQYNEVWNVYATEDEFYSSSSCLR